MMILNINWLPVLVAAIANMAIGGFWYSPVLFAKQWMKLVGASAIFSGAIVGFWAWLGFAATTSLSLVIWEKRNSNWQWVRF